MLKGKDLLSIHDLTSDEVMEILNLAHELKAKQKAGIEHHILKGKTLGMIFEKSSTRTRVSFEVGTICHPHQYRPRSAGRRGSCGKGASRGKACRLWCRQIGRAHV